MNKVMLLGAVLLVSACDQPDWRRADAIKKHGLGSIAESMSRQVSQVSIDSESACYELVDDHVYRACVSRINVPKVVAVIGPRFTGSRAEAFARQTFEILRDSVAVCSVLLDDKTYFACVPVPK